ncbi:hypothetical protein ABZY44_21940 [Streptomyces sp. NPDC006544]|uniref:hypothetical protein n=1 Tax=Streptomyces sp. NPDC006544 TaxID=3154583 RepID=UPI0033B5E1B9
MTARRFVARCTAVTALLALAVGVSVGAYHDSGGGWLAVAAVWISLAILMTVATAIAWGLDNWNAR